MPRILHIDDDPELGALLNQFLVGEGFEAATCVSAEEGLAELARQHYDLLILDVMMPNTSGLDLLRALRKTHTLPVLMLTARGDDVDRIVGLELGADDYVPKPCLPREIVARIRAILRRSASLEYGPAPAVAQVSKGSVCLDPERRRVTVGGQVVELTSAEFNVLEVLMLQAGSLISKNSVCEQALGRPLARYDRSVDVHLSNLRAKLGLGSTGDVHSPSGLVLHTIRGQGVQLSEL